MLLYYVDDILVFSNDIDTHVLHLQEVFHRLSSHGVTLHTEKCQIRVDEVTYLGHVFSKDGMSPDSSKTKVIQNWIIPNNVIELRRFLGLASYYRRYIKNFSTMAEPLLFLANKGITYTWTPECQKVFTELQQRLQSSPILTCPDFSIEFTLYTDASDSARSRSCSAAE